MAKKHSILTYLIFDQRKINQNPVCKKYLEIQLWPQDAVVSILPYWQCSFVDTYLPKCCCHIEVYSILWQFLCPIGFTLSVTWQWSPLKNKKPQNTRCGVWKYKTIQRKLLLIRSVCITTIHPLLGQVFYIVLASN